MTQQKPLLSGLTHDICVCVDVFGCVWMCLDVCESGVYDWDVCGWY